MRSKLHHKHPLAIRWFHWINFPVLFVMIWSGLLIYWANDIYHIGPLHLFPKGFYSSLHITIPDAEGIYHGRLAEGMAWHFAFMWIFFINGGLYVLYTAISGEWRQLVPDRSSITDAIQVVLSDLKLSKHNPRASRKFNGAQQFAYTGVVLMGAGSLITGAAIYRPVQFAGLCGLLGGYMAARFIHFWLTMGYLLFFVVHIAQVVRAGWNNFRAMVTGYELAQKETESK